jgi:hypothetical protein
VKQLMLRGRAMASGRLLGLVLGCLMVPSSGCEKKPDADPSGKHESRSPELSFAAGVKIPEDWPKDVAIYPGSKVLMSKSNPTQQLLFLETPDAKETALEFYETKLAPMNPRATTNDRQQSVLSYQDSVGRRVTLSIGKQPGGGPKTLIALVVNRPAEARSTE